jgi:hypothetical protein
MTDKQARTIVHSLEGFFEPSLIAEALTHAASVPLVGDEDAQARALTAAVATTIQTEVDRCIESTRALDARTATLERDMAARDAAYGLQRMDCGTTVH